jgi:hypothetical protein
VEKSIELVGVNSKTVKFCELSMEKWNKRLFLNKIGSNAVATHSNTKRNISRGLSLSITLCIALIPLTNEPNRADCGYQVHGTERKISYLLYMDDLKLLGRNENNLKNEIKIVQTISKDINMNFGLEKWSRIYLKRSRVQSKMHISNTFENDIKKLDTKIAYKYEGSSYNTAWARACITRSLASFVYGWRGGKSPPLPP